MFQKLTKKMTLLFALSCVLSLGIGVALGYGIHTHNLTGTAALPDMGPASTLDIETLMMAIQMERANLLEQQLKDQMDLIQERNQEIIEKSDELAEARLKKEKAKQQGDTAADAAADKLIEKLKSEIDALNLAQQTDMVNLQYLSSKRNEAFDMMANLIAKMQESRNATQENMR